jgi:hypothetical protein
MWVKVRCLFSRVNICSHHLQKKEGLMAGRITGVVVLLLCASVFAQNAELNCVIDDRGTIWLNGEQVIMPKKQEAGQEANDTTSGPITLIEGDNVLAVFDHDGGWTGGMCASIDLSVVGVADTVISDDSWVCMDSLAIAATTGAQISVTGYDASSWVPAGDYGVLAGPNGENPKPFFERKGFEPFNLWSHGAIWLWTPKTIYIRKSFQAAGQTAAAMIRGNGFTYRLYVNGTEVGSQTMIPQWKSDPLDRYDGVTLNNGENVVAIEATCYDSIDFAFIKAAVQWGPSDVVYTDNTWKYAWASSGGWNSTGFSDASWVDIGVKTAYDGTTDALTPASWIWATDLWFRKVFNVPSIGTRNELASRAITASKVVSTQYFTLLGERIPQKAMRALRPNAVVIERSLLSDGSSVAKMIEMPR